MQEKAALQTATLQKSIQQSLKKPQAKEACLSFQYKLQLLYASQYGVYLLPQLNQLQIWHGVIFIRFGLFKDAKFKFSLDFAKFPRQPPVVKFFSSVYHPRIHPQTKVLDLGLDLTKNWNYGQEHLVCNIVQQIRLVFLDPQKYETIQSFNPQAGKLFKDNINEFYLKIRDCVNLSNSKLYENIPQSSFKFQPCNEKHLRLKESLTQICEEQGLSMEEKKKKFLKLVRE